MPFVKATAAERAARVAGERVCRFLIIPDPSGWGTALADFPSTECDIASHFRNQSIIANIDLCGQLAAQPQYYEPMYKCPGKCEDLVANHPSAFEEAYCRRDSALCRKARGP